MAWSGTISKRVWNTDQSWYYERVFCTERRNKLRVYIRRNAYDSQSYAKGYVYDESSHEWKQIVSIPITQCQCKKVNYVLPASAADFAADDKVITDELLQIVEDKFD